MRTHRTDPLSGTKVKSRIVLKKILLRLKKAKKKIAFTNGCFDILHYGHVKYLEEAKQKADVLVVAVNSDSSVRRIKGKLRPLVNELDRARTVAGLASVDFVTVFEESTPYELIKLLKPDVLVKGADWKDAEIVGQDIVKASGGKVIRIKLVKGRSTSEIIKKIAKTY